MRRAVRVCPHREVPFAPMPPSDANARCSLHQPTNISQQRLPTIDGRNETTFPLFELTA
jgi:hypothetical protein